MKKTIAIVMLVVLVAAVSVLGTLAYLTDTKTARNTFTLGNVKIDLIEQQKGETGLEEFKDKKVLVPGKSNDGNAVSKIVTVENTGTQDAWVWVELKIPTYLVSNAYPTDESRNALHWNSYGCFNVEYNEGNYWRLAIADGIVDEDHKVTAANMVAVEDGLWYDYKFVSRDDNYVTIRTKMQKKLPAGKVSLPCLAQVYMDWRVVPNEDGSQLILPAGDDPISVNASWEVIVNAYAIQADGFATVDEAIAGYANNGK